MLCEAFEVGGGISSTSLLSFTSFVKYMPKYKIIGRVDVDVSLVESDVD
jgi:hypothetical protein